MLKKLFLAVLLASVFITPVNAAGNQKILGVAKEEWLIIFADFKREIPEDFLDKVKNNEKELKKKRDADHFERLGSNDDPKRRTQENPLWGRKKKHRYVTSLELSKSDFARVADILRDIQDKLTDEEIEKLLPYISLCLNEGMKPYDIRFYINRDIFLGTQIDLMTERLYRELKLELGEI